MISSLMETHLKGFRAGRILEIGPGYGDAALLAAKITGAHSIVLVDCDDAVLSFQKNQATNARLEVECINADLAEGGFERFNGMFKLILCQEVLEHLTDAETLTRRLASLLHQDGKIVITVPTKRSERWLKWLNPDYMRDEPHGHVREFDERSLRELLRQASLYPCRIIPTQPHYFIAHTWLFGTRAKVKGATGSVDREDLRTAIFRFWGRNSRRFFSRTGPSFWGRLIPRNYFVVAEHMLSDHDSSEICSSRRS